MDGNAESTKAYLPTAVFFFFFLQLIFLLSDNNGKLPKTVLLIIPYLT